MKVARFSPVLISLLWFVMVTTAQNQPKGQDEDSADDLFYGGMKDPLEDIDRFSRGFGLLPSFPCPSGCICSQQTCGKEVDCSGLSLTEVPKGLSPLTECLDMSMNNISKISVESFIGLKDLKKLCLSGNFITELPPDIFPGFRKMHTLLLQDNLLTSIRPNTISKMPNLKDLNLGANYISDISPNAFAKLDGLEHIWLDDNSLKEIPTRALSKAPNIKALSLDMNNIEKIENGDLRALSQMKVLLLKHNKISKIESNAFEGAKNIEIVDLSYNDLTSFPPAIKYILNLKQLYLNNNKIETLPDVAFAGNPDLKSLAIAGNPLRTVGRTSFSGLQQLEALSIEDAEDLENFPDFSGCSKLEELSLVGGKISNIPRNLCLNLPSLKRLSLRRNRLRNLSGLVFCSNLTTLDLNSNELTNISSSETRNLTKLKELDLSSNRIRQIDQYAFSTTSSLQKMNLAYNSFTFLPVKGLQSLRELNVSGVRTLLYLPPIELLGNLQSLVAFYPYHCCQLAKTSQKTANQWFSQADQFSQSGIHQSSVGGPPFVDTTFPPIQCSPDPGPLTPCDDLLPSTPLRIFSWISMIAAFLLNGLILFSCSLRYCVRRRSRLTSHLPSDEQMLRRRDADSPYSGNPGSLMMADSEIVESRYCLNLSRGAGSLSDDNDCFDLALCHLAFADIIVAAYTAVILSYDSSTRGNFAENGAWWQQSAPCHSAGFLLTFGTQLAFSTIAVMAVERYLANVHPLQPERHMRKTVLILALTSAWVISLTTATLTLFGGGSEDTSGGFSTMLPAQNGAACLPWTTEFAYIAVLVSLHVFVCFMAVILCILMFCARRKQSWLSSRKSSRRQVALAVAFNITLILPLAVVALYVSGIITYSDVELGEGGEYYSTSVLSSMLSNDYGRMVLDMGRVLAFVMYAIPLRPLLNPVLYIVFNKPLRRDLSYLVRKIFWGETKPRHLLFPPNSEVLDTMYESSEVSRDAANNFPLFPQSVFDPSMLQQTAYENGGIAASSSVSYHTTSSAPIVRCASQNPGSLQGSGRRKRRRRSARSRRSERPTTTDTDPTTESEVITFHRGEGSVLYNHERRRKKMSVRNGGVNARDEFQRLIFPRVGMSSSSQGSNSTIYPIMPNSRSAMMSKCPVDKPSCAKTQSTSSFSGAVSASSSVDTTPLSRQPTIHDLQKQTNHYDLSALNSFRNKCNNVPIIPTSTVEINNNKSMYVDSGEVDITQQAGDTSYDADMEVAGINSSINSPEDEPPFFTNKDTTIRCAQENASTRRKTHQRAKSREEDYRHVAVRNATRGNDEKELEYSSRVVPLSMTRKDSATSHASTSGSSEGLPVGREGKTLSSCEYCDSSASKDSGIHSEIDSASGASYSDTSIGRRLRFSTSTSGTRNIDVSTIGEREIDRFELAGPTKIQEFQIIPTSDNNPDGIEVMNTETTI